MLLEMACIHALKLADESRQCLWTFLILAALFGLVWCDTVKETMPLSQAE